MSDILDRLKHWASIQADGSQLGADLREGIAEIGRLRGVAGAVSDGPELATIKNALAQATASNCGMQMPSGFYLGDGVFAPNGSGS